MTVFFVKDATTVVPIAATNNADPATGNQSPLWTGLTRNIGGGSYAKANVVQDNLMNRVIGVNSIERVSVMTSIIKVPIQTEDIVDDNVANITYIKIPFSAIDIGGTQELYGVSVLGYKKANPAVGDFDFISASPHYAVAPVADDSTDKVPVRIIDAVQSDREKITIKISVPADAGQAAGYMTRAMMRSLLVGNYIVLQLLTSE